MKWEKKRHLRGGKEVGECPKNGEKEQIHLYEGQITS